MKRLISLLLPILMLLGLLGCGSLKVSSTVATSESESVQPSFTTMEEPTTTEATTTASPTPATTYIEGIGEVVVSDPKYLSKTDFAKVTDSLTPYGFISLGYDNPTLLDVLRDLYSDDSLTIEDVGFYQPYDLSDNDPECPEYIIDAESVKYRLVHQSGIQFEIVRYFLAMNNLRMWIDEVPYSVFETFFPDYLQFYKDGDRNALFEEAFSQQDTLDLINMDPNNGESLIDSFISIKEASAESQNVMRFCMFFWLMDYNECRYDLSVTYSPAMNFIPIAKSVEERYVLIPSTRALQRLQELTKSIPKCEALDITRPETYDDLVISGVNVDLIEKTIKYAGIKIPLLSE